MASTAGATAYLGDDVIDLPAMRLAGLPVAVADAHPSVRALARWITTLGGGRGAARELCDLIIDAREAIAGPAAGMRNPAWIHSAG